MRTTLHQMGVVKDAVERQARSSLGQLDAVMLQRRHREALARLGEVVWDLAKHGELGELGEHEEIAALLDELAELEDRAYGAGSGDGTVSAADWSATSRSSAPARGPAGTRGPGRKSQPEMRVWRPSVADIPDAPDAPDAPGGDAEPARDPGPAVHARGRAVAPKRGPSGLERSEVRDDTAVPEATDASPAQERGRTGERPGPSGRSRGRRTRGRDDQAAGGIAFMEDGPGDEDDDLAGYMHEDDVPPRG